jgi:hypothetical protein
LMDDVHSLKTQRGTKVSRAFAVNEFDKLIGKLKNQMTAIITSADTKFVFP